MKILPAAQLEAAIERIEEVIKKLPDGRKKLVLHDLQNLRALAVLKRGEDAASYKRRAIAIAALLRRSTSASRKQ